ncbi:MAG TPA: hypothetical protein VKD21_11630, partial [Acidimicrobiales bacterium]|nr:hypothetical protein [Acidimicrobiales bacterium]
MLTRRAFIRSSAALGAVGCVGGFGLLGCHGGAHRRVPESIDNTGATDVSEPLTNWLASTGAPGDVLELRRRPDGSPGRYWVPRGVRIGRDGVVFDMKGCHLFTGTTLGFDDPLHAYPALARAVWPPLWDDWREQTLADAWPDRRSVLVINASNVTLVSSNVGARIQGANRLVHYRGSPELAGRTTPTGAAFYTNQATGVFIGDGQHCIRLGAEPGGSATANPRSNINIDLTNISVEFSHGDGIYLGDNITGVTITGRQLGESVLGGVPSEIDDQHLWGHTLQGGTIQQGGGAAFVPGDERSADRWVPDAAASPWPGIHHTGRQGIATSFRSYQTIMDGFSIWRTGRSAIDWEPAWVDAEVVAPTMRNLEIGIHTLGMMPCAGANGPINDLVLENIVSYEVPIVDRHPNGSASTDFRSENWRLENIVCPSGVKPQVGAVFRVPGIDGI